MRRIVTLAAVVSLVMMIGAAALARGQASKPNSANSLGKVTLDAEVGWTVGSGQFDGEFVTAEVQGIVIGLRAQERFSGLLGVTGTNGDRVGVYQADTGSTGGNNGTWNFDFHVDLSGGFGNAAGRTLEDYTLVLWQDYTTQSLFGGLGSDPVMLPMTGEFSVCTDDYGSDPPPPGHGVTLCEQSWNPGFGNTDYNPLAERTYNLRLVLTPETFNGPPLAVSIQVVVSDA